MTRATKKQLAEQLYIHGDMNQKEIAAHLAVTEKTVSKWKIEGRWDELKAALITTTNEIVKNLLQQNLKITKEAKEENRLLSAKETDMLVKNAKTIKLLSHEVNLVTVIMVFKKFNVFLSQLDLELAKQNVDYQRKFIAHISTDHD